jgi:rhodanese-related sulfurtransferase
VLIDVREPDEVAQGSPAGAERIVRGFLELRVEDAVPDATQTVLVMCAGGVRSLFAAEGLHARLHGRALGRGRLQPLEERGLPVEVPRVARRADRERYARHLLMPEVGEAGQQKLLDSKVLMIGAGGLGSPRGALPRGRRRREARRRRHGRRRPARTSSGRSCTRTSARERRRSPPRARRSSR